MTVCVATLFAWNYGTLDNPQPGLAAITASDQMITAGDVQYEPPQQKIARVTPTVLILVAGDYATHSEAIQATQKHVKGRDESPYKIALIYGQEIQRIKRRQAEDVILAPLGLNTDTFLAQQKDMSDYFASDIREQLQRFSGHDVAALVVGSDGSDAHIYEVDARGTVSCMDDVCFAAIGAGAWHAKSQLMISGYTKGTIYAPALAQTYVAKRRGETAPGVGARTDIHVILRDDIHALPYETQAELDRLYSEYSNGIAELAGNTIKKLGDFLHGGGEKRGAVAENQENNEDLSGAAAQVTSGGERQSEGRSDPDIKGQERGAA